MAEIRFDDRVALVTGAGGGLGRAHARVLAARGAKVVVNDLGGALDGSGGGQKAADAVVEEIRAAGGEAVASYDGVDTAQGGQKIVATAMDAFGRLDIVVNNAGILRDTSFAKMTPEQWAAVLTVHLDGSFFVTKAAWPIFRDQKFGRVVFTSSAAGLYGNFGQANYGAAKMGLLGLSKTLAQEGKKYDIKTNVIAPVAASRMTDKMLAPEVLARLEPQLVSELVAYLSSEGCEVTGECFAVGGGYVSRVAVMEAEGAMLGQQMKAEDVGDQLGVIMDLSKAQAFPNAMEAAQRSLAPKG